MTRHHKNKIGSSRISTGIALRILGSISACLLFGICSTLIDKMFWRSPTNLVSPKWNPATRRYSWPLSGIVIRMPSFLSSTLTSIHPSLSSMLTDLSVRMFECPDCKLNLDRDHNAAINILKLGLEKAQAEKQQILVRQRISKFASRKQEAHSL